MTKTFPIVGGYYRPPASALLKFLPQDTPLILRPEPTNAYDPNAIMVLVEGKEIPVDYDLDSALAGYGTNIAEVRATPEIHLGYIPRGFAATMTLAGDTEATFSYDSRGKATVKVED